MNLENQLSTPNERLLYDPNAFFRIKNKRLRFTFLAKGHENVKVLMCLFFALWTMALRAEAEATGTGLAITEQQVTDSGDVGVSVPLFYRQEGEISKARVGLSSAELMLKQTEQPSCTRYTLKHWLL